jgi:TRAP-type transport system small permease protein
MSKLKKIGLAILDFVEVWMPVLGLLTTFVSFIVNVVARYIFNSPVNACYELCLGGLLWCLLLSAPYAVRTHTNVAFTLIYDNVSAGMQLAFRLIGNAFMLFCFIAMLWPCTDWVLFMARKYTAVLKIRMSIVYFPFVIFNVLVIAHLLFDFVKDVILLVKVISGKETLHKEYLAMDGMLSEEELDTADLVSSQEESSHNEEGGKA